jgi:hypothetical protein
MIDVIISTAYWERDLPEEKSETALATIPTTSWRMP